MLQNVQAYQTIKQLPAIPSHTLIDMLLVSTQVWAAVSHPQLHISFDVLSTWCMELKQ
jgi:hypothetical protein